MGKQLFLLQNILIIQDFIKYIKSSPLFFKLYIGFLKLQQLNSWKIDLGLKFSTHYTLYELSKKRKHKHARFGIIIQLSNENIQEIALHLNVLKKNRKQLLFCEINLLTTKCKKEIFLFNYDLFRLDLIQIIN